MLFPDLQTCRLTYLKDIPSRRGHPYASYLCSCGEQKVVRKNHVDTGKIRSCGCLLSESSRYARLSVRVYGKTSQGTAWAKFLQTAKRRGKENILSRAQWLDLTQKPCAYCGVPPSHRVKAMSGIGDFICNGIDRVDNAQGYTPENSVPCCYKCNSFKSAFGLEEFLVHVEKIQSFQSGKLKLVE